MKSHRFQSNPSVIGHIARKIGVFAFVAACAGMLAHPALADNIWGRQGGNSALETKKVDLETPKTIVSIWYQNTDNYCIWAGVPSPQVVLCGRGDDQVGTVLPAGRGYFLIPALSPTNNMRVYVNVKIE